MAANSTTRLSPQARRFLEAGIRPPRDRSPDHLPTLRAEERAYITPGVERTLAELAVTTTTGIIAGVPCLTVAPVRQAATWPILYGYGGGFVMGSPYEDLTIAAPIAVQTGARVIIPDYRLAPEHPWPAGLDDGFAVYKVLADDDFAIVGESAGGNFALSLMVRARQAGLPLPRAAALLSPWCDLTNSAASLTFNAGRDPTLAKQEVDEAAAHYAGFHDKRQAEISPLFADFDDSYPPCMITSGTRDLLLSPSEDLAARLSAVGVPVTLRVWEEMWHVFEWNKDLPEAAASITEISAFLSSHMG